MIKIIFPRKEKRTASYNLRAPLCALAVSLFLSAAPLPAQDKLPKPADFAGEITLDGEGGRLLKIELPEAVFRGLRRSDLGDIRVFDADGAAVPFLTRPVPGALETPPPREIPFFPWKEEAGRTLPETADIELDAAGTVLRVKSRNAAQLERQAYLLDLSGLEYPPAALKLEIDAQNFFNAALTLFSSSDLNNWDEFAKRQIIAWYGDSGASRTTVEIPGGGKYLILRFDRAEPRPKRILALFSETRLSPPLRETVLAGVLSPNRRALDYSAGGFFPMASINWKPGETDSLDVLVKSKASVNDEWNSAGSLTLYRLSSGGGEFFYNKPLAVHSPAPFWRIESAGESALSSNIECVILWTARELVFLGRGRSPWTLAYGSAEWGRPEAGGLKLDEYPGQAEIAPARITGEIRYTEPAAAKPERPWGQWLLWSALIASVIILLTLAFITAKSMSSKERNHE